MIARLRIWRAGSRIRERVGLQPKGAFWQGRSLRFVQGESLNRYQPLANFVLLERIDETLEMHGNIVIPEIGQVKSNKGRVIAVGEGRLTLNGELIPIPLAEGDIVLFSKYGAEDVVLDSKPYLLLRYDEIKLKEKLIVA